MRTIFFCALLYLICLSATCRKIDCSQTDYSFEAFYKAYPAMDSIKVGDTIWLDLNAPTQLKNVMTNQMVDYSGAENLGTAISYLELLGGDFTNPGVAPAANSFDNVVKKGIYSGTDMPERIRTFLFTEENAFYIFKLGIIPKKKGSFAISPGNAANVYRKSDKCSKAGFSLTFIDTDQHLYLYEQSRPGYTPSQYEREHTYCIKVY